MSITSVNSKIKAAMQDAVITKAEAQTIVNEAEKGPVTVGEARVVRELFERQPRTPPPGMMVTMAIPEHPGDVMFEQGAKNVLETFFTKNDVPAGKNLEKFVTQIQAKLAEGNLGARLESEPNTKKLHLVRLPRNEAIMDGPTKNAFLDPKKNEFYLCIAAGPFAPPELQVQWYGPISLKDTPAPAEGLSDARKAQILDAFERVDLQGTLEWKNAGLPMGAAFERTPLKADGFPDGYSYSAIVITGAMSPTAPQKDPNSVESVIIERSGGFAGWTQYATINVPVNDVAQRS